jgi:hypothetical protein
VAGGSIKEEEVNLLTGMLTYTVAVWRVYEDFSLSHNFYTVQMQIEMQTMDIADNEDIALLLRERIKSYYSSVFFSCTWKSEFSETSLLLKNKFLVL